MDDANALPHDVHNAARLLVEMMALRDALSRLSLALQDGLFEMDLEQRQRVAQEVAAVLDRAKVGN